MVDPDTSGSSLHETGEHARAGATPGVMRYVLAISLALAVVILSLIVWVPVLLGGK